MAEKPEITQKDFELLLNWLDKDREIAAAKYESLHRRLVKIFLARKAFPAEELADRTMDIALRKIDYLINEYDGDPKLYFYKVAHKIFQESLRQTIPEPLNDRLMIEETKADMGALRIECLEKCLQELSAEKREMFVNYFQHKKRTKIESHKKMAQSLGIDVNSLRTKVYRIKLEMEKCIRKCVKKKIL